MKPQFRRLTAFALVVLLVSSSVAAPVAGTTASTGEDAVSSPEGYAATSTDGCSALDMLASFATLNPYDDAQEIGKCLSGSTTSEVEEVKQAEDNQTALQIYNAASAQAAADDQFLSTASNYANDTRHAAWSAAEVAYYKAIQNGSAKAVAREKAMRAIEDYFTRRQMSLKQRWEIQVRAAYALHQRAVNETGVSDTLLDIVPHGQPDSSLADSLQKEGVPEWNKTATISYVNGSTTTVYSFGGTRHWLRSGNYHEIAHGVRLPDGTATTSKISGDYLRIVVNPPSGSDISQFTYFDTTEYATVWNRYSALSTDLKTEFSTYVNNTYPAVEDGRLNASQVLSTETRMFNLGTAGGDGTLYDSVAALANLGLATPSLNGTGTMTVYYNNREYHGLLLAPQVPNGTWRANTTYNASTPPLNNSTLLATTGGKTVHLSGEFRVGTISTQSGGTMQNVSATRTQYQTANVSKLLEQINETQRLIAQVEARQGSGATNPDDGGGGGGSGPLIIVGLAVVAIGAAAVMQRDS
ncbi:hypothetical protein [Halarchaeum sp. P4]|uniref:hypothetical protein n=1 Tax=Halarchaeum sp. P4 TaxID=3421639 RepID=UPI003EB9EDE6